MREFVGVGMSGELGRAGSSAEESTGGRGEKRWALPCAAEPQHPPPSPSPSFA